MSYESMLNECRSWMENTDHVPSVSFRKFEDFARWCRGHKENFIVGIDVYRMLFVESQDNLDFEYGEELTYKGVPIILDPQAEPFKMSATTKR